MVRLVLLLALLAPTAAFMPRNTGTAHATTTLDAMSRRDAMGLAFAGLIAGVLPQDASASNPGTVEKLLTNFFAEGQLSLWWKQNDIIKRSHSPFVVSFLSPFAPLCCFVWQTHHCSVGNFQRKVGKHANLCSIFCGHVMHSHLCGLFECYLAS